MTQWRIVKRIEPQFQALYEGLLELISPESLSIFNERDLELLIGGIADIDMDDWQKHTEYKGYVANDETVQLFWKACAL